MHANLSPLRAQHYQSYQQFKSLSWWRGAGRRQSQVLRLKFTLHSPQAEAKKKSDYRQETLPEFSASLSPLLTQPVWGATSIHTESFSIDSQSTDVTTPIQQEPAPTPARLSRKKNTTKAQSNVCRSTWQSAWKPSLCPSRPPAAPARLPSAEPTPRCLGLGAFLGPGAFLGLPGAGSSWQPSSAWKIPSQVVPAHAFAYPGQRAGRLLPALRSGCAHWWRAGNSWEIISAERLLLWIVYIL